MKLPQFPSIEEILKIILEALNTFVEDLVRTLEWLKNKF